MDCPSEIIALIFSFLHPHMLSIVELVCKNWHNIVRYDMCKCIKRSPVDWAAENGFIDLVKFANKIPSNISAIRGGHLSVLQYMHERGQSFNLFLRVLAAAFVDINVLMWFEQFGPFDSRACSFAADTGRINTLKWLLEKGYTLNKPIDKVCSEQARQWLIENKYSE